MSHENLTLRCIRDILRNGHWCKRFFEKAEQNQTSIGFTELLNADSFNHDRSNPGQYSTSSSSFPVQTPPTFNDFVSAFFSETPYLIHTTVRSYSTFVIALVAKINRTTERTVTQTALITVRPLLPYVSNKEQIDAGMQARRAYPSKFPREAQIPPQIRASPKSRHRQCDAYQSCRQRSYR